MKTAKVKFYHAFPIVPQTAVMLFQKKIKHRKTKNSEQLVEKSENTKINAKKKPLSVESRAKFLTVRAKNFFDPRKDKYGLREEISTTRRFAHSNTFSCNPKRILA